eukprot:Gb_35071 [translate_table: standard]
MYLLFCTFLLVFASSPIAHSSAYNATYQDRLALISFSFKNSITNDPFNVLANWNTNITFCSWTGVNCRLDKLRVASLELTSMDLEGTISPFLGNLSVLTDLDLYNNSLAGPIPHELGRLEKLRYLYLPSNKLEGSIPVALAGCGNLLELSLEDNYLTGSIPSELSRLTRLEVLRLGSNDFRGTSIPPSLATLSSLSALFLDGNNLQGRIPPELGKLTQLTSLLLGENHLTGPIPSSLSNMSTLVELALYENNLDGFIPPQLGMLTQLQVLYLWENHLSGNIPNSLANCSQLEKFVLDSNQLSGTVPLEMGNLLHLKLFSLSSNQLVTPSSSTTLSILAALTNCSLLHEVSLDGNHFTGHLPNQLPTSLSLLVLNRNRITGNIPQQIGNLTLLTELDLSYNLLTGHIPSSPLRKLPILERLWLDNNKLEGSIPPEIGELRSLGLLSLGLNMFSGQIPDTIGDIQTLRRLLLQHNRLSGNIPASLGNCRVLELLDLSNNGLSGSIPPQVAGLPNLQIYFNLSRNSLQGGLPLEMGQMIHVQAIDISENRLHGQLPATLGGCVGLQYLNLSSNALQGPIPTSIGDLKSLENMDLSSNHFAGSIPTSLKTLRMLQYLNLSFNNLSGEVPTDGVFAKFTSASFMGNPHLCGERLHLRVCPVFNPQKHTHGSSLSRKIMALLAGVDAFALCCFLMAYFYVRRRNLDLSKAVPVLKHGHKRIPYQELVNATDGFSETNLLGSGSFGSVYKGTLSDGTVAAIKVLNLQNEEARKSFAAECRALGRARHRNLVKIITSYSNLGQKILVLEFMSKGSLEKRAFGEYGCELSFLDLLNIAIDIAHGMEYLHHYCCVQIVHCDLKPSNVLLDDNMTARVADFGIARLICTSNSIDSLSSTLAMKGSIGYIAPDKGSSRACPSSPCSIGMSQHFGRVKGEKWNFEYGLGERVSTKGDVYSYGILLLEMLTRKRSIDDMFVEGLDFRKWVSVYFPKRVMEIVDRSLLGDDGEIRNYIVPYIEVSLMCTKESPQERPTMRDVVEALESIRMSLVHIHGRSNKL